MSEHGIPKLMKSKRFWTLILGLIIMIVTEVSPQWGIDLRNQQTSILAVVGLAIGGYSLQDTARELNKNGGAPAAQGEE